MTDITESTFIKSGTEIIRINFTDILYLEGMKDYVMFHLNDNKHIAYYTLKSLIEKLPDDFMRIHQSYIVNINKIEKNKDNHIYIKDKVIPISKSYRDCLKGRVSKHFL
ncbi:LytTR family DNA-binding domain-containing protein [Fulvivirga sp.]|uniref:LytR/AlgR family response regulator transcription factor n=1 Tax=Fulvivirga sp. TaxID=1931237 RepID=UPI0032EAE242